MATDNSDFLGGGPRFNKAGAEAPVDETRPIETPRGIQPHQIRAIVTAVIIIVMLTVLFFVSDPGGIIHKQPTGGRQLDQKPEPPSNF